MSDSGKTDKRMMSVTENYQASSVGRNFKTINEELQTVKKIGVGSKVQIVSGPHSGMEGKIVAVSKQSGSDSFGMGMQAGSLDPETYVSVELIQNNTVVQVKSKRIQLKSNEQKERDRSRSNSPKRPEESSKSHHQDHTKPLKWVIEGIRVRVVSKKASQGRLYGKVVNVRTVLDCFKFEACEPGSYQIIGDLREKDIETMLPSSKDLQTG